MKASQKKWSHFHSAHDYSSLVAQWKELAIETGLEVVSLCRQGGYETIALQGGGGGTGFYLSAGVHGDEPAPVWALLEWARARQKWLKRETVIILPCVNPWGLANNVRMDFRGRDLNRLFHTKTLPFFRGWRKLLGQRQFHLALNLHEDYDAQGFYVYELVSRGVRISDQVFDQIETVIPRENRSSIDGQGMSRGIIRRSGDMQRVVEEQLGGGWPEAAYLYQHHAEAALTFETPSELAFHDRVRVQRNFIAGAMKFFE